MKIILLFIFSFANELVTGSSFHMSVSNVSRNVQTKVEQGILPILLVHFRAILINRIS